MPGRYQRGDFVSFAFAPLSVAQAPFLNPVLAVPATTYGIKGHTLDLSALTIDVSNSLLGGLRGRIAGLADIKGTVNLSLDKDVLPWLPQFGIFPGTSGIGVFGLNPVTGIQCPLIVAKKNYTSKTDQEVQWNLDVEGNALAGVIVYPPVLV